MNQDLPEVEVNELVSATIRIFYEKFGQGVIEKAIDDRMTMLVEKVALRLLEDYEARKADRIAERIEQGIIRAFDRLRP